MSKQVHLTAETILATHAEALSRFGGDEDGCDEGLLASCFPVGERFSLFELAAAYAHGLIKNHPFLDGNKRCGFMAAALFLEVNGLSFGATEESSVAYTRALAAGEIGADEYAEWLKESCS